jgi:hypothetical protein
MTMLTGGSDLWFSLSLLALELAFALATVLRDSLELAIVAEDEEAEF